MATKTHRINWTGIILCAMFLGFVGVQGGLSFAEAPGDRAERVAVVNLEKVFDGLDQREATDKLLNDLAAEMDNKGQEKREQIDEASQDRDLYPTSSTKYQELTTEVAKLTYDLKAYREYAMRVLDSRKAESLREIYASIKSSIAEYASIEGYVVVFVDDSIVELPLDASEAETTRQISARRMLYTDPRIDITTEVVEFMNKAFAAP